jgi:NADPH-dependent 2,4-dienoyl-CoA reductase/sulfur reductase-like enzyme/rhodanese-related sulfurtransferase
MAKKILIIGGVAGGASCAARLRRLDENCEITILERGPYVSFANCGLPYYVGDVITEQGKLVLANAGLFRERFRIDVQLHHEAVKIDAAHRVVSVRHTQTGNESLLSYDALVLSPGAAPIRPPLPGIESPGIFQVRTIPDADSIRRWITERCARSAVVVGGGFIGVEMAENLLHRGLEVTLVEMLPQILPNLDPEMAWPMQKRLEEHGCQFALGDAVAGFAQRPGGGLEVQTKNGSRHGGDLVILGLGVRPETALAREAGVKIGSTGGIEVDQHMRTSDPHIWAVGDAVQVKNIVTGQPQLLALAGPANRQGRVAADNIAGRPSVFRGVQGTSIVGVFGLSAAGTGCSETALRRAGITGFEKVYLHPLNHVGYYPGAKPMHLKILFRPSDGRLLGAQAVGEEDIARRIDVISAFLQKEGTVHDLAEAELCYAPQFGAAKDPVNFAGMVASNARDEDMPVVNWDALPDNAFLLDVRDEDEFADGHVPGSVNIPLSALRRDPSALPKDRPILAYCRVGQRGYYAVRFLRQHGYDARNVSGGILTWENAQAARAKAS